MVPTLTRFGVAFLVTAVLAMNVPLFSLTEVSTNSDVTSRIPLFVESDIRSKKILVLLPEKTPSHQNVFSALINVLLERGHYVTFVSSATQETKHPNLREILTKDPFGNIPNMSEEFFKGPKTILQNLSSMFKLGTLFSKVVFENKEVLALKDEKFDLVITEAFFFQEPLLAFAHYFDCPNMVLYSAGYSTTLNYFTGGAVNPAYVPHLFGAGMEPGNFLDRFKNTVNTVVWLIAYQLFYLPQADFQMREVFPHAPSIQDLLKNISLTLINNNNALMSSVPLAPSVVQVAGLFIKPGKELPADLKKWMEDSKNGVVYFSLGSNLKANSLPQEKQDALFRSFGKLEQRVLLKWNGDIPANAPENCRFEKWVSQQEVLAHPNLKVFVTHGGLLSTQESVHYGVPLIGLPVYGDQYTNIAMAAKQGFAVQLSIFELTSDVLDDALNEVISNTKYREKAKELSLFFRLDPMPPLEKAVYYTEKLLKLGNLKHLQPTSVNFHWYQCMLLDVIAVILITLYAIYRIIRFTCDTLLKCFKNIQKRRNSNVKIQHGQGKLKWPVVPVAEPAVIQRRIFLYRPSWSE